MTGSKRSTCSVRVAHGQTLLVALWELTVEPAGAVRDGRVFVNDRRVDRLDWPVRDGDRIDLGPTRRQPVRLELIDEHAGVLAVHKPAGVVTEPDRQGSAGCLLEAVGTKLHMDTSELHALNRLDTNVSGVVLVARTAEGRRWIEAARRRGDLSRRYVAIAWGAPSAARGDWDGAVRTHRGGAARPASTRYMVVGRAPRSLGERSAALLALEPRTGRTHQLRVHCTMAGVPLLGDRAYGGPSRMTEPDGTVRELDRVALHAARVAVKTPAGTFWTVRADVPEPLVDWWTSLGGARSDWDRALGEAVS